MASGVISVISVVAIAASVIVCVLAATPVQIDERHLQQPRDQADNEGNGWQDSVPGLPGRDYPNLTSIPETSFTCAGKTPGGYYADVETRCQVFHVCSTNGAKSSFLCPSGSVFNQRHFVCDWWYDFICEQAPELYALNRGLDDRLETSSSTTPLSPIDPSVQFNSIAGSGGDLSLASSGYPNNIKDDSNAIYEDYSSVKIADSEPTKERFSSVTTSSTPSAKNQQLYGDTTQVSATSGMAVDNYSKSRQQERLNTQQQHQIYGRNHEEHRRPLTYRRRPIHGMDNVPRGFSKDRAEEEAVTQGSNYAAGSFVNNGLSNENDTNKNFPLPRENNNYVDNNNYNDKFGTDSNHQNMYTNNNFNGNNYYNNNNNYFNDNNNNRYENHYQSTESQLIRQDDNSNRINQHFKYNSNNNNEPNNNYDNNNKANNDLQNNNNNYYNLINVYDNDQNSKNNYYNENNVNSNDYYNPNQNSYNNENYNQKEESIESSTVKSYSTSYDFPNDDHTQTDESSSSTRTLNSSPTEDEVDRERQREVDSADLKRKRPQPRQQPNPSPTFIIREEFTPNVWRDDLSTSSTSSQGPPYPPNRNYLGPSFDGSSLSKPIEVTTPVAPSTLSYSKSRPQDTPKFLGRRPTGGLPSGTGNGLPGASKVLIGSDAITNAPGVTHELPGNTDKISGSIETTTGSSTTISGIEGNRNGANSWDVQSSTYLPPQRVYNEFRGDGQYDNWNNAGQAWNSPSPPSSIDGFRH